MAKKIVKMKSLSLEPKMGKKPKFGKKKGKSC
jgi:hypothetical protein